jgi:hypothetical protein
MDIAYFLIGRLKVEGGLEQIVEQVPKFSLRKQDFVVVASHNLRFEDVLIELAFDLESAG